MLKITTLKDLSKLTFLVLFRGVTVWWTHEESNKDFEKVSIEHFYEKQIKNIL